MESPARRAVFLALILFPVAVSAQHQSPRKPPKTVDWNRVHALLPGLVTRVRILKNEAPRGERNVKGFFSSSTDTSITLLFPTGQKRTFEKRVVSTVRVRRPFKKRHTWWIIGVSTAVITGYLWSQPHSDYTRASAIFFPVLYTTPATVAGLFMMPTRLVYRATPNP